MTEQRPTLEEWRRLYAAAANVKELSPWQWMLEDDLFGLQNPETGEIGFVSVMGNLGEHLAVSVYLGPAGLDGFLEMREAEAVNPDRWLEIPQLQVSFEDRQELKPPDHVIVKKLGLKFRGRQVWPLFRSVRPGWMPWYVTAAEARFLTGALEQLLNVAPRVKADQSILWPGGEDEYLVRVARQTSRSPRWEDHVLHVAPEPVEIAGNVDAEAVAELRRLPPGENECELDFFRLPVSAAERNERPYVPYMLMLVEEQTGVIVASELLKPDPSLAAMQATFPARVVHALAELGTLPTTVRTRSPLLRQLLQPVADEAGFTLKLVSELSLLDPARELLLQMQGLE